MRRLAKQAGVSLGAVHSNVQELIALGEVEVIEPGGPKRSALFRLPFATRWEQRSGDEHKPIQRSVQSERSVQSRVNRIINESSPPTPIGVGGTPDKSAQLFEAFFEFWTRKRYSDKAVLTRAQRGRINKAVKECLELGIGADEVRERGKRYHQVWPNIEPTPQGLLGNWAKFEVSHNAQPGMTPARNDPATCKHIAQGGGYCVACASTVAVRNADGEWEKLPHPVKDIGIWGIEGGNQP
jgi:hypothetical protein